jgi:prohibitin 1
MKTIKNLAMLFIAIGILSSCTVVRQGEVGVKRTLGKIQPTMLSEGAKVYNPFITTIIKVPTRTMNIEVRSPLPSKEGLTVQSDISILYRVENSYAPQIVEKLGREYDQVVVLPVFRSAVADVSSKYFAKDMHTGQRASIDDTAQRPWFCSGISVVKKYRFTFWFSKSD